MGDSPKRIAEIVDALISSLPNKHTALGAPVYRQTRKERYFATKVLVRLSNPENRLHSSLEINCPDHPGILATVGKLFVDESINIKDARITTLGERVEDLFYITNRHDQRLVDAEEIEELCSKIEQAVETRLSI